MWPFCIVVPLKLLPQWIEETQWVASDIKIYKYYEDKKKQSVLNEIIIRENLNKDSALFNNYSDNVHFIVFTIYETLVSCHDVQAQHQWCIVHDQWNFKIAKQHKCDYDQMWLTSLNECFDTVILDKAHLVKNSIMKIQTVMLWLKMNFYLCLITTSLLTEMKDFAEFLRLIESVNTDELWSSAFLKAFDLNSDDDIDLYTLTSTHSARILCVILCAANQFVFADTVFSALAETKLQVIWQICIIHYTYIFWVSFNSSITIEEFLSHVKNTVIQTSFTSDKWCKYKKQTTDLTQRLVYTDTKIKRSQWSFEMLWKLMLICLWPDFQYIES